MSIFPLRSYISNLDPKSYDSAALNYLKDNAEIMNTVAAQLGVSAEAIAGNIAREKTRADGADPYSAAFHQVLQIQMFRQHESTYESEYAKDLKVLVKNPGAFDGNPILPYVLNATRRDIGPGSIKVVTAINLIREYTNTPEGKALGLGRYDLHNIKQIVEDLDNSNSSLSIFIAGLVILNGTKFFQGKSIAGIPWENLTQAQQDAALTAYYTVGEHAVKVDMEKNEFYPFTTGPKGGQVGPWILFGDNYARLRGILAKFQGASFAPKGSPRYAIQNSRAAKAGLEGGNIIAPDRGRQSAVLAGTSHAQKWVAAGAAMLPANNRVFDGRASSTAPTKSSGQEGWRGVAPLSGSETMDATLVNHSAIKYIDRVRRMQSRTARSVSMPSSAPRDVRPVETQLVRPTIERDDKGDLQFGMYRPLSKKTYFDRDDAVQQNLAAALGNDYVKREELGALMEDHLNRQARLPPSGYTGFDPWLSPAWPGRKLPN